MKKAVLGVILCTFMVSCNNSDKNQAHIAFHEIELLNEKFNQSIANKNLEEVISLYSENVIWLPPNEKRKFGIRAVRDNYKFIVESSDIELTHRIDTTYISSSNDLAVMIGTYYFHRHGESVQTDEGKFSLTLVKENGEWRIHSDLFNSDF